jgi:uncharacterized protein
MEYRTLGRTNLRISVIGLGGDTIRQNTSYSISKQRAQEIISVITKSGINFIDMGKDYDEAFLSQILKYCAKKPLIVTRSECCSAHELDQDIDDSCIKLKKPPEVYQIFVRSISEFNKIIHNRVLKTLLKAKNDERIGFTGIFSHNIEVLKKAIVTNNFDVVMTIYNSVNRKAEELFILKKKYKFGFIAAAPLASGILVDPLYDKNIHVHGSECMTADNALKFALSSPFVDAVTLSMKNNEHILQNISTANKSIILEKSEREYISKKARDFLGKYYCRMCRYCMNYSNIPVPDVLKLLILYEKYGYKNLAIKQYEQYKANILISDFQNAEKVCPYKLPVRRMLLKLQQLIN